MQKQANRSPKSQSQRCLHLKPTNNKLMSSSKNKLTIFQFDIAEDISLVPFFSRQNNYNEHNQTFQMFKILKRPSKISKYRSYLIQLKSQHIKPKQINKNAYQQSKIQQSKVNKKTLASYLREQKNILEKPSLLLPSQRSKIIGSSKDTISPSIHQQSPSNNANLTSMNFIGGTRRYNGSVKQGNKMEELSAGFKRKLKIYLLSIKLNCRFQIIPFYVVQQYSKYILFYQLLDNGNNSKLIRKLMNNRWWWQEQKQQDCYNKISTNFSWSQLKIKKYFQEPLQSDLLWQQKIKNRRSLYKSTRKQLQKLSQQQLNYKIESRRIHNHFERNQLLSSNLARHYLMESLYKKSPLKFKQNVLMSFHVQNIADQEWQKFTNFYFNDIHQKGQNSMWILKPITVKKNSVIFRNYNQIKYYLKQQENNNGSFLLQKYISHPFLYKGRKFGVYCYLLITRLGSSLKAYLYQEGYIGTTTELYNPNMVDNIFMHCSNTYVQVQHNQFGLHQPGNKLNFQSLQKYLKQTYQGAYSLRNKALPKIKTIAAHLVESSCNLLKSNHPQFQLFQLQFIMDSEFNPWLRNISTNPCLQILCPTIENIIPKLIDDTFKLTIDLLFPAPAQWPINKRRFLSTIRQNNFCLIFDQQTASRDQQINDKIPIIQFEEDIHTYEDDQLDYLTFPFANKQKC